jgi:two-component system, cell cycle sensor histidine kinase and response regulator CckA
VGAIADPNLVARFRRAALAAGLAGAALGAAVIAGWVFDIVALKSLHPSMTSMKANTAACLLLLGVALALLVGPPIDRRWVMARVCAGIVLVVGALTLLQYITGATFGIDELLLKEPSGARTLWRGRMSPPTALCLFMGSLALITIDVETRSFRPAQVLVLGVLIMSFMVLSGYLYGAEALYNISNDTQIALHTSAALFVLALGSLCARPERGIMTLLTSQSATGGAARRFLPAIVILTVVIGYLRLEGQRAGLYGTELGVALFASSVVVLMVACAWIIDAMQFRTELRLIESEESLETTLNSIGDGVIATDTEKRIVRMNPVAQQMTGWSFADARGAPLANVFRIVSEESRQSVESPAERVLREGRVVGLANHTVLFQRRARSIRSRIAARQSATRAALCVA